MKTTEGQARPVGALTVVSGALQLFAFGSYEAPLFKGKPLLPPQMNILCPLHTAPCNWRASGEPVVVVSVHESAAGL